MRCISWFRFSVALGVWVLGACAGNGQSSGAKDSPGDFGCEDCGEQGEMELEIFDERKFVEMHPKITETFRTVATVGSFPTQKVFAMCPEGSKICHSFSDDAVDFDLAHFEDSLLAGRFPEAKREQMLEGLRIPEGDSLWIREALQKILSTALVDGKSLLDTAFWKSRTDDSEIYSRFEREIPREIRQELAAVSKRYNVRYLTIPVFVRVEILPKLGKSGGFRWMSLWTLWDARLGNLLFLSFEEFGAKTKSRIAPERHWAKPFAERLGKDILLDPQKIENH